MPCFAIKGFQPGSAVLHQRRQLWRCTPTAGTQAAHGAPKTIHSSVKRRRLAVSNNGDSVSGSAPDAATDKAADAASVGTSAADSAPLYQYHSDFEVVPHVGALGSGASAAFDPAPPAALDNNATSAAHGEAATEAALQDDAEPSSSNSTATADVAAAHGEQMAGGVTSGEDLAQECSSSSSPATASLGGDIPAAGSSSQRPCHQHVADSRPGGVNRCAGAAAAYIICHGALQSVELSCMRIWRVNGTLKHNCLTVQLL